MEIKVYRRIESFKMPIAGFARTFILILFLLLAGIVFWHTFLFPQTFQKSTYYTLLFFIIGIAFLIGLFRVHPQMDRFICGHRQRRALFICLLVFCFLVKLSWVLLYQVEPAEDYYTFFETAKQLSQHYVLPENLHLGRYISIFPHIFGYSSFLSLIFFITGNVSPLTAAVTNVILSTLSMALVYYIGRKLISSTGAIIASLIWIFFPSQTIYNMFILSEPYYTTLLLFTIAAVVFLHSRWQRISYWKLMLYAIGIGTVLVFIHATRPVAVIFLIALLLYFFFLQPVQRERNRFIRTLSFSIILCLVLIGGTALHNLFLASRIGEAPATSLGYSFYVGFNSKSHGTWNEEDSAVLQAYSARKDLSTTEVQDNMMKRALLRIRSESISMIPFFYQKVQALWHSDSACISYAEQTISHPNLARALCDAFYQLTWLMSAVGAVFMLKRKDQSLLLLLPLYVIGLTISHLITEVAVRYHYSGIITLTLLAAYGIHCILETNGSFLFHYNETE